MSTTSPSISLPQGVAAMPQGSVTAMALSALGVVFGDIGTSPLYTLKTVLALDGGQATARATALGSLSLIVWTLIVITTIKYVSVAMRVDNHGEGGIMALMALLGGRKKKRGVIVAFGLFGAALIYGDGAITPAISVLSALEGLSILTPKFDPYIVPHDGGDPRRAVPGAAARHRTDRQDVRAGHARCGSWLSACSAFGASRKTHPCLPR